MTNNKMIKISDKILLDAGFEFVETIYLRDKPYDIYRKWTDDKYPIKLDIDNDINNGGTSWHLHIDNSDCDSIGCADIDYVWQFNMLMKVFRSKFRL